MKTTKEIINYLKERYAEDMHMEELYEHNMYENRNNKRSKEYKNAKERYNTWFIRNCELTRIYADINDISFKDAMDILNNYKKSRRVAQ